MSIKVNKKIPLVCAFKGDMYNIMKEKTCCLTGHRSISLRQIETIMQRLKPELVSLIESGIQYFGVGGAQGFDTIAALTVLELKEEYPHIRLILVLPCRSQAERWSDESKVLYEEIKQKCDKLVCLFEHYSKDCMLKRNRHLVDNSSVCVCYLTKQTGGTAYTVERARVNGLKIINIAER